ncbi:hypothetical protein GCM10023194_20580 [Planotetraspora phitsanulokensis]|uniref:Uncharacterized protein n=1 Tax=Planotetraspora phitsanulokensis TaxID=575192 RepID=A0A8J3U725_9ACTN|nr:hypothetical protein [Planotetraspora phitsanulokensis]GII39311.1 hypothetical protein Pph01_43140 [Planotetraspora phitsanulokensis]
MRDEYLLAALRLAAGADPVPGRVGADARAAFHLRLPGGVVAAPVEVRGPAGARSGDGTRGAPEDDGPGMHRFSVAGLTIDVEAVIADGILEVAGQVSPAPGPGAAWQAEIRTSHVSKTRDLSENGRFAVGGLPTGWVSVVCHRPGEPPVSTRWLHVRS